MPTYLTENDLRARSVQFSEQSSALKSYRSTAHTSVFLSHSHLDKELVKGLVDLLAKQGIDVYVDWKDSTLPASPTRETANQIKLMIERNDVFMLLATQRALNSKWVPWELGIADKAKGYERIVIVPVTGDSEFQGSEYVQIYRSLEKDLYSSFKVFEPGRTMASVSGSSYLARPNQAIR